MPKKKTNKTPQVTSAFTATRLEGIAEELTLMLKAVTDSVKTANAQADKTLAVFHESSLQKGMVAMRAFISELEMSRLDARIGNPRPVGMRRSRSVDKDVESAERNVAERKTAYRKSTKKKPE